MKFKRIFVLILDSLGVGEAIDANNYGDNGSNTLKHIMENYDLFIPNLEKLGFLNTLTMDDKEDVDAYYTIARPTNTGKDSLTGHYEIVGIENKVPFKTFAEKAFPIELIDKIEEITKKRVIGNKVINGEQIINELGERHMNYGSLILYTSNDSTLQIAAHEDIVSVSKLHTYCEKIRKITLNDEWKVARVIARPFNGKPGKFKFTNDRKDFAVKPPQKSILNELKDKEYGVIAIGKISDVFDGEGITKTIKGAKNNIDTINKLTDIMSKNFTGVCLTNLNDFDALYGHNRDLEGYGKAIEELDVEIPMILNKLNNDDLLIITADHGNDPSFGGNAHTRENVPVILFGRNFKTPGRLEPLQTMADIGATIAENFGLEKPSIGTSFLDKLK
ncbi:MAG: phosphopentomutase [Firmicutes bacterium]|nr:phosphopentomutase [Bacillota bacterium]